MAYNRFIDVAHEKMATKYNAGIVHEYDNGYIVVYEQKGAEETFSIGQPVYDEEGNVMGYLGIGMYDSLTYANDVEEKIPVEHWTICLPTRFCESGKKIYTYYQNCERKVKKNENKV